MLIKPNVAIIIPTYNRADYLRETLRSALSQTYPNIKVLVLDDASSDHTPCVIAEFLDDPRVSYVRQPKNLGLNGNWKAGIDAVTEEFFCILNDDDTIEPEFVECLLHPLLENEDLILSFGDHWIIDENSLQLYKESEDNSERWKRKKLDQGLLKDFTSCAVVDQAIFVGATLFRSSLVSSKFISEQSQCSADVWLIYECARTGYGAYYISKRLMNYRIHSGAMTQNRKWRQSVVEGDLFRYEHILNDPDLSYLHEHIKEKIADALSDYGMILLTSSNHREGSYALEKSLQLKRNTKTLLAYRISLLGSLGIKIIVVLQKLREKLKNIYSAFQVHEVNR